MGAAPSSGCLAGVFAGGRSTEQEQEKASAWSPASQCSTNVAESAATTDESGEDDDETAKRLELESEPASPSSRVAKPEKRAVVPQEDAVIIFDWDDTLLPTTALTGFEHSFVNQSPSEAEAKAVSFNLVGFEDDTVGMVSEITGSGPEAINDSEEALATAAEKRDDFTEHAELVSDTLRAARKLGRVFIVTLSARPWVPESARRYLPGVDMPALLDELDITVFYANESPPCPGEGVAQFVAQKRCAMTKCMNTNYSCSLAGRGRIARRRNVLSIGDSDIEQMALKEVLDQWGRFRPPAQKPRTKTLKLREKPSVEELGAQLRFVNRLLAKVVSKDADFHLTIDESTDLATPAPQLPEP